MSEQNLAAAYEVFDAIEHRALDRLLDLTHPEIEWDSAFALGGRYLGHSGMRQYVKDMNDAWGLVRFKPSAEMAYGDLVVFAGRIEYRGKESGAQGTSEMGYFLKFREGKLIRFRPFHEPEAALEAVGLP